METRWYEFSGRLTRSESAIDGDEAKERITFDYRKGHDFQYRMISQDFRRTGSGAATLIERWYGTPGQPDGYDGAGNLLLVDDSIMPERDRVYSYDEMSRLIGASAPNSIGALKYTYDRVGNRTKYEFGQTEPPKNFDNYTYDPGSGLLSVITQVREGGNQTSFALTHDEVGNLTDETDPSNQTYGYNLRNQLEDHNGLLSFVYNAHGRRVKTVRTMAPFPGKTITHYLLPDGRPYLDVPYSQSGSAPQWSYVYLGDRLLARFDNNSNYEHVVTDHIGFPLATIDNLGAVLWQPDPVPFGTIHDEESVGDGHDPLIRYPGQWAHDPFLVASEPEFSTLYYNFHRWYKPGWGRYSQTDPVGNLIEQLFRRRHLYVYAENNPLALIDPQGLDVHNNGPKPICIKPEKEPGPVVLQPGETHEGPVDGVSNMDGEIIKITDPYNDSDIEVGPDGVNLPGPDFFNNMFGGGKLDCPPDAGWKPIFECAKGKE